MRQTKTSRPNPVRPERSRGAPFAKLESPIDRTFGPAGELSNDGAEENAAAEWLAHVQAGRIG